MSRGTKETCGSCKKEPVRGPGQHYCRACQTALDLASAKRRRLELQALREEVKALRRAVARAREALTPVAVPDSEC